MNAEVTSAGPRWPSLAIATIVLVGLVLNLAYALIVPLWMGPDEPRHVEYVLLLLERGRLVAWGDQLPEIEQKIIRSMDQVNFWRYGIVSDDIFQPGSVPASFDQIWSPGLTHELHQPPLYYLAALPLALVSRAMDIADQVRLMRLLSVVLATGTIIIAWLTAREGFPDDVPLALASASLVAFLPMHAFMAGVVNNDVLAELLAALTVYLLVRAQRRGFSLGLLLASLLTVCLCVLAKRTTVFLVPLFVLALCLQLIRQGRLPSRRLVGMLLVLGAVVLLAVGRAVDMLERVTPHLPGALQSLIYVYVLFLLRPSTAQSYAVHWQEFISSDALAYYQRWLKMLFESFWACFGWANVRLGWWLYVALAVLTLVAIAGSCLVIWEGLRGTKPAELYQRDIIVLLAGAVLLALSVLAVKVVREWDSVPRATMQARMLFPALVPIAVLFAKGLLRWTPGKYRVASVVGLALGLVCLNAVALIVYIMPFYRM